MVRSTWRTVRTAFLLCWLPSGHIARDIGHTTCIYIYIYTHYMRSALASACFLKGNIIAQHALESEGEAKTENCRPFPTAFGCRPGLTTSKSFAGCACVSLKTSTFRFWIDAFCLPARPEASRPEPRSGMRDVRVPMVPAPSLALPRDPLNGMLNGKSRGVPLLLRIFREIPPGLWWITRGAFGNLPPCRDEEVFGKPFLLCHRPVDSISSTALDSLKRGHL